VLENFHNPAQATSPEIVKEYARVSTHSFKTKRGKEGF
jgi:hypothetical protein